MNGRFAPPHHTLSVLMPTSLSIPLSKLTFMFMFVFMPKTRNKDKDKHKDKDRETFSCLASLFLIRRSVFVKGVCCGFHFIA